MATWKRDELKKQNPCVNGNVLNYVTYCWTAKIFKNGNKRDLSFTDLYEPLSEHSSAQLADDFTKEWNSLLKNGTPSLFKTIFRCFKLQILLNLCMAILVECGLRILQCILLGKMVSYYIPGQDRITIGELRWYASGVVACAFTIIFISHPCAMSIVHLCMKYRVGCCALIYRKALKLSKMALRQTTVGHVVNLLSNDVGRFDVATILINYIIVAPLQVVIIAFLMWWEFGISGIVGILVLLLLIPFQLWLGKQTSVIRAKTAKLTDNRLKMMNEILVGIHIIKMYAWEKPISKLMKTLRRNEMNNIKRTACIKTIVMSFGLFNSRFALFCSILTYVLNGNVITAEKIYILVSFYGILKHSLAVLFPQAITLLGEICVTINRLQEFLLYKETSMLSIMPNVEDINDIEQPLLEDNIKMTNKTSIPLFGNNSIKNIQIKVDWNSEEDLLNKMNTKNNYEEDLSCKLSNKSAVYLNRVNVKWSPRNPEFTLNNINLNIKPGSLVAIVGPVGSGKSTLFYTLLKEVQLVSGIMNVNGVIAYASQEPWLFDSTINKNIVFGADMNNNRYRNAIKLCELDYDITKLTHGDETLVGERGVALSGGQKARINLARAVYRDADIYLLDDPLSAVDVHVGKQIFDECIVKYLKGKTRLLITHQPQFLNKVDHIIVLKDGCIVSEGTYASLKHHCEEFDELIQSQTKSYDKTTEIKDNQFEKKRSESISKSTKLTPEPNDTKVSAIDEERNSGSISFSVYKSYVLASGPVILFLILVLLILLTQFFASATDYWIGQWVNMEEFKNMEKHLSRIYNFNNETNDSSTDDPLQNVTLINQIFDSKYYSRDCYTVMYTVLILSLLITVISRTKMLFCMTIRASIKLHNKMFEAIIRSTMRFFHNNPSGRIMNRFSRDMGSIDEILPAIAIDVIQGVLQLVGIVIVIMIVNFWLAIPVMLMLFVILAARSYYLSPSRSLKRLEAIARSPIYTHLSTSLHGMTTIRAFNAEKTLIEQFDSHQDLHSSTWFIYLGTTRAFGLLLDIICVCFMMIVTVTFVMFPNDFLSGNVGLAITQAMGLIGMIQWTIRSSTEMENYMTCVERVLEYQRVEQEPALVMPRDCQLEVNWSKNGSIAFNNVHLKYAPNTKPVLINLTFMIEPREKVGIIGRTGSGKSSIINALFRMAFLEGTINIDDVDICSIGLHKLRSNISIIPQEPVLFSGNIRQNIDPFEEYSDEVIWKALEEVELKNVIKDKPEGLDSVMAEEGSNYSIGQRQLFCLARALIRSNKILVLDEATANVDLHTDNLIQNTIRRKFSHCTILTIAHRLQTIIDSDRIMVMDAGRISEFDHPHVLLQNNESMLFSMVKETKEDIRNHLIYTAKTNFEKKH